MTTVPSIAKEMSDLRDRVSHLEKILIIGDGERLPLAEIVRNLTKTVESYITQKDKEEQKSREWWDKFKWVVIGFAVPAVLIFIGQAIIFFFKIYPILEKLSV